jgi:hypothetical protein
MSISYFQPPRLPTLDWTNKGKSEIRGDDYPVSSGPSFRHQGFPGGSLARVKRSYPED